MKVLSLVTVGALLAATGHTATIKFAVVVDQSRADQVQAVNKAVSDINSDSNILNGHTVNPTLFEVDGLNRYSVVQALCNETSVTAYDAWVDVTTSDGRCVSLSIAQAQDSGFMSAHRERCFDAELPSVHFNNDAYFRAMALVALSQNASREAMAVFYDDSFADIGAVIPMEKVRYVPTYLYKLPTTAAEIKALLNRVKTETAASEFVIASTASMADTVLTQAASLALISNVLHWFVVTRDLESITCTSCGTHQVIHIRQAVVSPGNLSALQTAVTSWSSLSYKRLDAIFAYEAVRAAAKVMSTLTAPTVGTSSFSCNSAENLTLHRYTEFVNKMKSLNSYDGIVAPVHFNNMIVSKPVELDVYRCSGSGCVDTGTKYSSLTDTLSSMMSFTYQTQEEFDVVAVVDPPFVLKNASGDFTGYSVDCLDYISKKLNFKYKIRDPKDPKYGVKKADGTWSGMIGEVAEGKADMAIGAITINAERESVVDMTIPYYDYAGLQILMAKKSSQEADQFYFLKVFTLHVWLCIGATLLITGILVTVFDKLSPYSFQNKTEWKEGEPEGKIFSIKESMWFVLGAYTMAGESFDPRATSTRMLVAGFWIFSFIMYAMYTANLAASLTVSKLATSINSVKELSAQTDVKYTVIADTVGQTFFSRMKYIEGNFFNIWKDISIGNEYNVGKVSKYSVWEYPIEERYTDMYDRMELWGLAKNTSDAVRMIKTKQMAAFIETPFIKYLMGQDCDLVNVGEVLSSRPYGIVLKNKSPLTRQMNLIILEMQRDRIMEDYKVEWWSKNKTQCVTVEDSGGIKLSQLAGVFIFLAIGVGCGALVLLGEFAVVKIFGKERFLPEETDAMAMGGARPVTASAPHINMRMQSAKPRTSAPRACIARIDGQLETGTENGGETSRRAHAINMDEKRGSDAKAWS